MVLEVGGVFVFCSLKANMVRVCMMDRFSFHYNVKTKEGKSEIQVSSECCEHLQTEVIFHVNTDPHLPHCTRRVVEPAAVCVCVCVGLW